MANPVWHYGQCFKQILAWPHGTKLECTGSSFDELKLWEISNMRLNIYIKAHSLFDVLKKYTCEVRKVTTI